MLAKSCFSHFYFHYVYLKGYFGIRRFVHSSLPFLSIFMERFNIHKCKLYKSPPPVCHDFNRNSVFSTLKLLLLCSREFDIVLVKMAYLMLCANALLFCVGVSNLRAHIVKQCSISLLHTSMHDIFLSFLSQLMAF